MNTAITPFDPGAHRDHVVALRNAVFGYAAAHIDPSLVIDKNIAVHPEHRMRGLGSLPVAHAERALTERGCMKINLQIMDGNEPVAAFYASLGYSVEPRISMGKRIQANIPAQR